jgi:endonuclease/exonuclease/phosphatase family metal-dependent hydrolase
MLTATLQDLPIGLVNTHLSPNFKNDWSENSRYSPILRSQIDELHKYLVSHQERYKHILISGDFNIDKGSHVHDFMKTLECVDIFESDVVPTYHPEFTKTKNEKYQVDYILLKSTGDYSILNKEHLFRQKIPLSPERSDFVSDHLGLRTTIRFTI